MTEKPNPAGNVIAVILPAHDEAQTIAETILDFHHVLPSAQIWVVNNQSNDNTAQIANQMLSTLGCTGGVIDEMHKGKGNAIRRAFLEIKASIYILADADMTYPAEHAKDLIAPILIGEADMTVGDRQTTGDYKSENKRFLHNFGNKLVSKLVNILFKAQLTDVMSGYRAISYRFIKNYPIIVDGFEIETDMTLHALDKRFRIIEIPIKYRNRPSGSISKLNTLSDGLRVLKTIWNILRHYRPLLFFTFFGLLFSFIGLLCGIPVIQDWLRERYIHHVPLAILATGLQIVAVVLVAIGLTLDSIIHLDKLSFERELLKDRHSTQSEYEK
jgi:glycosyltransferase involved in cell wall biosynthesis